MCVCVYVCIFTLAKCSYSASKCPFCNSATLGDKACRLPKVILLAKHSSHNEFKEIYANYLHADILLYA